MYRKALKTRASGQKQLLGSPITDYEYMKMSRRPKERLPILSEYFASEIGCSNRRINKTYRFETFHDVGHTRWDHQIIYFHSTNYELNSEKHIYEMAKIKREGQWTNKRIK